MITPEAARTALQTVADFLNEHPEYCVRVREREDGTTEYRLVMQGEPCFP